LELGNHTFLFNPSHLLLLSNALKFEKWETGLVEFRPVRLKNNGKL